MERNTFWENLTDGHTELKQLVDLLTVDYATRRTGRTTALIDLIKEKYPDSTMVFATEFLAGEIQKEHNINTVGLDTLRLQFELCKVDRKSPIFYDHDIVFYLLRLVKSVLEEREEFREKLNNLLEMANTYK